MTIRFEQDGDTAMLCVTGRVDTNTSADLQEALLGAFEKHRTIILDFENVSYISSAGLRALLIGQKTAAAKKGTLELARVPTVVLKVLEAVGFTKILTIR